MPRIKLTKTELKRQKEALRRFERYLPMLQMKKQQLQREIDRVRHALDDARARLGASLEAVDEWCELLGEEVGLDGLLALREVELRWENIAGVDVPEVAQVHLQVEEYDLFTLPLWVDAAVAALRELAGQAAEAEVLTEQERRLARELRVTSQRVNLFEHVKIPEARENIRRISVYLGDQQTAAFGWALTAKRKLDAIQRAGGAP